MEIVTSEYIKDKFPDHVHIYTDGFKLEDGWTMAAVYVPSLNLATGWLMNWDHSILGAEIFAIFKALQLADSDFRLKKKYSFYQIVKLHFI